MKARTPSRLKRGSGPGSSQEAGNVLVISLITSVVLLIGLVALSSRTSGGLFGAVFQSKNREAREVAESALSAMIDTLNRTNNRYLLAAGNGLAWANGAGVVSTDSSLRNPCTQYNSSGTKILDTSNKSLDLTKSAALDADIASYAAGAGWKNLVSGNSNLQYQVESILFLDSNRNSLASTDTSGRSLITSGISRGLMRVVIQARVLRNGRYSYARVAREVEVVPKCCYRSFGRNKYGGGDWGRDERNCLITDPRTGGYGVLAALGGETNSNWGSANTLSIFEGANSQPLSTAICWNGNLDSTQSELTSTVSPLCTAGSLKLGSSVSLIPTKFNYQQPDPRFATGGCIKVVSGVCSDTGLPARPTDEETHDEENENSGWQAASGAANDALWSKYGYTASPGNWIVDRSDASHPIVWVAGYPEKAYNPNCTPPENNPGACDQPRWFVVGQTTFNSSISTGGSVSSIDAATQTIADKNYYFYDASSNTTKKCSLSGSSLSSCSALTSCYSLESPVSGIGPSPYAEVFCNFNSFSIPSSGGGKTFYVDTTNARMNFYLTSTSATSYLDLGGSDKLVNVHCSSLTTTSSACSSAITWSQFQQQCNGGSGDPRCSSVVNRPYDTGELFNIFGSGSGTFTFNGGVSGAGFNLYSPKSDVTVKGGGGSSGSSCSSPNLMGRIWADKLYMNGSSTLCTLATGPSFCTTVACPSGFGYLYDLKARSYTQASGF